mmetsp:Transcript_59777/g.151693  ORF Transcript_59777/g.151693 Transcript_59777/m.151693 type:complete len:234 (-) Transcript_59777:285-986(-)
MLQDPFLDVLQAIVVFVEDALGPLDVFVLLGVDTPRHARDPLQVGSADIVLGRRRLQRGQLCELGLKDLLSLCRQGHFGNGISELGYQGLLFVLVDTQLLHDIVHLRHQHDSALLLRDLLLRLGLHPRLEAGKLEILLHDGQHLLEPVAEVVLRQHRLQFLALRQGHPCDEVCELQRVVEVVEPYHLFELFFVHQGRLQQVLHLGHDFFVELLDFVVVHIHLRLVEVLDRDGG